MTLLTAENVQLLKLRSTSPRRMLIKMFSTDSLNVPLLACGALGKDSPPQEIIFAFFAAFTLHSV
jgi:hypothetical protein